MIHPPASGLKTKGVLVFFNRTSTGKKMKSSVHISFRVNQWICLFIESENQKRAFRAIKSNFLLSAPFPSKTDTPDACLNVSKEGMLNK